MSQQIDLKDRDNRTIGYLQIADDGVKTLKDRDNRTLGYYYPSYNETRDRDNRTVGYGDILTSLLPRY